ncbi:MAG: hypothetical protein PHD61_02345 [Bacteroidales bacterium]|nr:hypothetical protein [Lentimicrobiaceae bacterium]MDD5694128.1 hypothetical protein [Bacteroidales bacterium]
MLNRDSFPFGVFLGAVAPAVFMGILFLLNLLIEKWVVYGTFVKFNILILVSITLDLIIMRYYFVKLGYDRTGRGILLITFIYMMSFFIFFAKQGS